MKQTSRLAWTVGAMVLLLSVSASAQTALEDRLDTPTLLAVRDVMARAEANGIASEILRNKALEGAGKGADGPRIVQAVERLYERLLTVRGALGDAATPAEQLAGAALLDLGVDAEAIVQVRRTAPERQATSALVGLAFLVQRGVPPDRSVSLVREMLEARVSDADFVAFQRLVDQDVRAGMPVLGAADARGRAIIRHGARLRTHDGAQS
jgi:hypothetical protein